MQLDRSVNARIDRCMRQCVAQSVERRATHDEQMPEGLCEGRHRRQHNIGCALVLEICSELLDGAENAPAACLGNLATPGPIQLSAPRRTETGPYERAATDAAREAIAPSPSLHLPAARRQLSCV